MLVIGIETSGREGSIALVRDGQCLESRTLDQPGRRHAQSLVQEFRQMLDGRQLSTRDVDAIAVSRGPGSFTGLRVGIVCAKTYAFATGCRFVGVDTFAAVAMNCGKELNELWIVEDAQRGDLFAGGYRQDDDGLWRSRNQIEIVSGDEWLSQRSPTETIAGRGLLQRNLSDVTARCLLDESSILPKASAIATLGERMLQNPASWNGADFDFWKSVPFYVRKSAAEEKRDEAPFSP